MQLPPKLPPEGIARHQKHAILMLEDYISAYSIGGRASLTSNVATANRRDGLAIEKLR
jgi:hypothetical protein